MTVQQLIEWLQKQPQDAIVIHTFCSDYEELEEDDFNLMQGVWDRSKYDGPGRPPRTVKTGLVRHKEHLMVVDEDWCSKSQHPKFNELEFITAVYIKGN